MMRLYVYFFLVLTICAGIFLFYDWAYDNGYEQHRRESDSKAVQCVIQSRSDMVTAGAAVQKVQDKIEKRKTKDEICRDVLNFDVRGCL